MTLKFDACALGISGRAQSLKNRIDSGMEVAVSGLTREESP